MKTFFFSKHIAYISIYDFINEIFGNKLAA